jgi:hypothetical protein
MLFHVVTKPLGRMREGRGGRSLSLFLSLVEVTTRVRNSGKIVRLILTI